MALSDWQIRGHNKRLCPRISRLCPSSGYEFNDRWLNSYLSLHAVCCARLPLISLASDFESWAVNYSQCMILPFWRTSLSNFPLLFFINYVDELSLLFAKFYVGAVRGRVPNKGVNTYFENAIYSKWRRKHGFCKYTNIRVPGTNQVITR